MEVSEITKSIMNIQADIATLKEQNKWFKKRVDEQVRLSESVHRLALSANLIAGEVKQMRADLLRLQEDIDEIKAKPARRWEDMVKTLLTVTISAVAGCFLSRMGVK